MDQARAILKLMQKHHFWLLCLVAIAVGLVGWLLGSRSLSAGYLQNKMRVVGKFNELDEVRKVDPHPNSDWQKGVAALTAEEQKKVKSAWELVYGRQARILRWPDWMGEKFLKDITANPNSPVSQDLLERYQNRVSKEFPKLLAETIGGPPAADASKPTDNKSAPQKVVVKWEDSDREAIQRSFEWKDRPSPEKMKLAQEDLWVYRALLEIIKGVNKDVYIPPIKKIERIVIGEPAAKAFAAGMASGHIFRLQAAEAPAAEATQQAAASGDAASAVKLLDENRYVDAAGKPLGGGATANDQFKRMPVFLRLNIDQREIMKLLIECANSPLPVEVRQLRISPTKSSNQTTAKSTSGAPDPSVTGDAFDVPIELNGIIYIYNPPDNAKLGITALAEAGAPGAATASAEPTGQ